MELELLPLSPVALALTLALGLLVVVVPRRWAALPILVAATFLPSVQRLVVLGLDFSMVRILILFAGTRLLLRSEWRSFRWHALDAAIVLSAIASIVTGAALEGMGGLESRLGRAFDVLGMYFCVRIALRTWADLLVTLRAAAACLSVCALFMTIEWATGRNLFSSLGGVPDVTVVRQGRLRCQGAFSHPIMAGVYGACWVPVMAALWFARARALAVVGAVAGAAIAVFSASSTSALGLALGLVGLALHPLRAHMRLVRWAALATVLFLHFVREAPVWHLFARINVVGGSGGYHRYLVIDRAIQHFGEWWLVGTREVSHWNIHWNDITNQYVATGINGGLVSVLVLLGIFWAGYRGLGLTARRRSLGAWPTHLAWALGAALFVHTGAFLAASYFGQMTFIFYLQLALVGSVIQIGQRSRRARSSVRRGAETPRRARSAASRTESETAAG